MRRMSGPPACGPAAVENVPLTIRAKAATTLRAGQPGEPARNGRRGARGEPREQHGGQPRRRDGDEEVAHDEQRVEVEEDRHGTERDLPEREQRDAARRAGAPCGRPTRRAER